MQEQVQHKPPGYLGDEHRDLKSKFNANRHNFAAVRGSVALQNFAAV